MASFSTNKYRFRKLDWIFNSTAVPTNFIAHLITDAATPTVDTNTFGELTESSNYSAITLTRNTTDFPNIAEDDATNDRGEIDIRNLTFTASGGNLTARWMIITDDNGTPASREVYLCFDLQSNRTVSDGQDLNINDNHIYETSV